MLRGAMHMIINLVYYLHSALDISKCSVNSVRGKESDDTLDYVTQNEVPLHYVTSGYQYSS